MPAAPFFNTSLIVAALQPLVPDLVLEIVDLSGQVTADVAKRLKRLPGLLVAPGGTDVSGDQGAGNGRWVTDRIDIVVQLYDVAPADNWPRPGMRTIRGAIWEILEAARLDPEWAPLRYESGRQAALDDAKWTWIETYQTNTGTTVAPRLI